MSKLDIRMPSGGSGGITEAEADDRYLKLDTSNDPLTGPLEIELTEANTTTDFLSLINLANSVGLKVVIEGTGITPSVNFVNQAGTILFRCRLDSGVFQVGDAAGLISGAILSVAWTDVSKRGIYLSPPVGQFQDLFQTSTGVFAIDDDGDLRIIKSIAYDWPSSQGAANTRLKNDGSGNLTWGLENDSFTAENKDAGALSIGMAVATHTSGTGVNKARADSNATRCIGLSLTATNPSFTATIQTGGVFTLANWTSIIGSANLSANTVYYLDASTAGLLTSTAPTTAGQYVQRVGTAISPTSLEIEIEQPILL